MATIQTGLDSGDIGSLFQHTTRSMVGLGGKLAGLRGNRFSFFAPEISPSDFPDLEVPQLSLGATIPTFSGWSGGEVVLHLYVWDRGAEREVRLMTPYSLGGKGSAERAVQGVIDAICVRDADAVVNANAS